MVVGRQIPTWTAGLLSVALVFPAVSGVSAQAPPPPPAASGAVPAAPGSYAVPPPPAPRYPAAPNLNPSVAPETNPESEAIAQLRIPADVATRLRVLSADLNTLAARGGGSITDGVFSIVTGGVLIGLGVVFSSQNDLGFLAPQFYVFGSVSVGRGLIDVLVVPDPSDVMLEYGHMPMTSVDEVKARLRFGETGLEDLAYRSRLARLLDGGLNLGAGATLIGLTLSANDSDNPNPNRTASLIMGVLGATTLGLSGAVSLLSSSDAERRWEAYSGLRDRLGQERALRRARQTRPAQTISFVPVVTPELAAGIVTVRF